MRNTICIEGVVGAGKTTLGELLAKEFEIEFYQEPFFNNPFLEKFYSDKKRYSLLSQLYFLDKRMDVIEESSKNRCVVDRSIYGDFLFAKMHAQNGFMSEDEFELYKNFWNKLINSRTTPKLIIFLDISVDNALKKIRERGRDYELNVEREYWEKLNETYSEFFNNYSYSPILKIDINDMDIRDNEEDRKRFFELVRKKLDEIN